MGGISVPDLKIYYRVTLIKIVWCLWKDRVKTWKKKIPHKCGQMNSDKIVRAVQWNRIDFSTNGARGVGYPRAEGKKKGRKQRKEREKEGGRERRKGEKKRKKEKRKNQISYFDTLYLTIISKWATYLNVKYKTRKLSE